VQTFNVTFNTAGTQTLTASNVSDSAILANTSPLITVNPTNSTTTIGLAESLIVWSIVTFTATVIQVAGRLRRPHGHVQGRRDDARLGRTRRIWPDDVCDGGVDGEQSPHHRVYGSDGNYNASTSGNLTQSVTKASSATSVVSAPNPSVFGQSVTLTATVTSTAGTPTGTVTFKDDATTLGTGTLAAGKPLSSRQRWPPVPTNITATYTGDASFNTSVR